MRFGEAMTREQLLELLNTPETESFDLAVPLESAHQVARWGAAHDAGKQPEDWFWLIGYLAGKALAAFKAGDMEKARHHCISTAAATRNWHAAIRLGASEMRPGLSAEKQAIAIPSSLPRTSCNRHSDCRAADEIAKAKGATFGASHCHDECCEDCFGC
jgi:hypothetical protein